MFATAPAREGQTPSGAVETFALDVADDEDEEDEEDYDTDDDDMHE